MPRRRRPRRPATGRKWPFSTPTSLLDSRRLHSKLSTWASTRRPTIRSEPFARSSRRRRRGSPSPGSHSQRFARARSIRPTYGRRRRPCAGSRRSRSPQDESGLPRTSLGRPSWPRCRPSSCSRSTRPCVRTDRRQGSWTSGRTGSRSSRPRSRPRSFGRRARRTLRADCWRAVSGRRSRRFLSRERRPVRRELLISPLPELGLVAMEGPNDPEPGLVVEDGRVVALDGKPAEEFDAIDRFIVAHGLDLDAAEEAMALSDVELARALVDVDVPRKEAVRLARGLTPARLARVVSSLDPVEMMFALKKLRARRAPANQAHVTNLKENPALLAADAAEAAARGFAEIETTVGVSRYAPLNAIAILVGSQTGRPGVLTQCAVEERRNLQLAIQGLVTYAEPLSVYGTEPVFVDGDDT